MAKNKTVQTEASVDGYIAAIADESRRVDCQTLVDLMSKTTKEPPKMWGPSIVGFGAYHYKYDSGREGDSCIVGFSSRKTEITLYLSGVLEQSDLLEKLGKHKLGKGCLYIKRLSEVDVKILTQLITRAYRLRKESHS